MATAASALPILVREAVPGYGVRSWPVQQLDEIAERIPHLHRVAPKGATLHEPTCLYDGQSWPCAAERWRRRHNHLAHASAKVLARRIASFAVFVVLGLQVFVADSPPASVQPIDIGQPPTSLQHERFRIEKAKAQAELRKARAALSNTSRQERGQ